MPSRESGFAIANRAIKVDKLVSAARRAARGRGITDPARIAQAARAWGDEHWTALEELTECGSVRSYPTVMERVDVRADGSQVRTPVVCICCLDCPHFVESRISVSRFRAMKRLAAEDRAAQTEVTS